MEARKDSGEGIGTEVLGGKALWIVYPLSLKEKRNVVMKFNELDIPPKILKALVKLGYETMTPIQKATFQVIHAGQDLCALAETGSGKTAACMIPLIQKVDTAKNAIQVLVIVPTRELCIQYVDEIHNIGINTPLAPFAVYGGFSKSIQTAKIKHEVHILVATPGRLIDLLYDHDGVVDLTQVRCVVLDEADELLKAGFFEDIEFILSCMVHNHQTLLFAATMADDIKKLAHNCLFNPQHISLITQRTTPKSIEHYFVYLHPKRKRAELIKYFKEEDIKQVIIFCNARYKVDKLFHNLRPDFQGIEYIHSGLAQDKRSSIFRKFKNKKIRLLIATDVAGRGLDFSHVSHIINWDFPMDDEMYTHRTGRCGRMGRKGKALTFVTRQDLPRLSRIIRRNNISPCWINQNPLSSNSKTV